MVIKTLVENTAIADKFESAHGLSLYIETKKHKLLFDLGPNELFVKNAQKLNIDISKVDIVVISHGHYDHGGGLREFLNINSKAKIYVQQTAFKKHYSNRLSGEKSYIGLDKGVLPNERVVFVDNHLVIDEELELFSNVEAKLLIPSDNQDLLMASGELLVPDDFRHEQNLIIKENGNLLMVAGCAHNGIVNILQHFYALKKDFPTHVIGGFHLYSYSKNKCEDLAKIKQIGEYLKTTDAKFYTCHCTGIEPYEKLKEIINEKIKYLATGRQFII
ncbi:MAG: metallo-beta-lactamase family protein [Firmicutes bacterium]|nr:metallo-beta-lactamase family protein [Bacillota bacterium]